jgi:hypothetical protein
VSEAAPVDDARLFKLRLAAVLILEGSDRHTPLELQWAQQVLDLSTALAEARQRLDELGDTTR